ncbi:hypothetical protein Scep_010122 [Stephania cephalantha]|uniref:Uncharacterized protein n=1 Tax=Stephania cephalantha TaxID=152367 RepID=A0AAP0PGX6_9MAGN
MKLRPKVARNVAKVEKKRERGDGCEGSGEGVATKADGADSVEDVDGLGAAADNQGIDADEIVDEHQQLGAMAR